MARVPDQVEQERRGALRVGNVTKLALLAVLGSVLVPLLIEGAVFCAAQWAEVLGIRFNVKTPLLSWSGSKLENCRQAIGECMSRYVHDASWEPGFALPTLAALIVIAMLMLRR
ncbi:MAG: hypothetical protein ACLQIB_39440 [Isosphaeraceae bacterium]